MGQAAVVRGGAGVFDCFGLVVEELDEVGAELRDQVAALRHPLPDNSIQLQLGDGVVPLDLMEGQGPPQAHRPHRRRAEGGALGLNALLQQGHAIGNEHGVEVGVELGGLQELLKRGAVRDNLLQLPGLVVRHQGSPAEWGSPVELAARAQHAHLIIQEILDGPLLEAALAGVNYREDPGPILAGQPVDAPNGRQLVPSLGAHHHVHHADAVPMHPQGRLHDALHLRVRLPRGLQPPRVLVAQQHLAGGRGPEAALGEVEEALPAGNHRLIRGAGGKVATHSCLHGAATHLPAGSDHGEDAPLPLVLRALLHGHGPAQGQQQGDIFGVSPGGAQGQGGGVGAVPPHTAQPHSNPHGQGLVGIPPVHLRLRLLGCHEGTHHPLSLLKGKGSGDVSRARGAEDRVLRGPDRGVVLVHARLRVDKQTIIPSLPQPVRQDHVLLVLLLLLGRRRLAHRLARILGRDVEHRTGGRQRHRHSG
mmetsp:Transcript_6037/g.13044  ORF Transcript_6037/g.13044 Transcript_6037/m.13044 type:complete len:477 (-) Transcript_6037:90-1520(-)